MELTREQRAAVESRGGSLMLSAAAGSGKTSVLTRRAVARILEDGVDADRLLIVTFTRAAAAEMKGRIVKELSDYIERHPGDAHARRQRAKLDRAQIGTIDSLCSAILREHFQLAGLPATFRIIEGNELEMMREDAVSAAIEEAYRADTPAFRDLAELFSTSKSDRALTEAVLRVLEYARAHPHYRRWLDEKLAVYREFETPSQSPWAQILLEYGRGLCEWEIRSLDRAIRLASASESAAYLPALAADRAALQEVLARIDARDWDGCAAALEAYRPTSIRGVKKANPAIKAARDRAKKLLQDTLPKHVFPASEAEFSEDVADLLPKIDCLFSLVKETDERLQRDKREAGVLDYADLSQMTCSLLTDETGAPTPFAAELAQRWDEVMVDEFQDVNEVQERLLSALALRDDFFCVGDVKQSIYRFRMARPQLFLRRIETAHPFDGRHFPAALYLNGNFRAAPEVTDVINETFGVLMSREVGDLDYDETQRLEPLASFPPGAQRGVDLCLLRRGDPEAGEDPDAEPAWVAEEIRRLLESGAVSENGAVRPVRPSDIAILLRGLKNGRGERYRRALRAAGIEAGMKDETGFLAAPEVAAVLHALGAIANPMRDLDLLGAMASPLFGFTDDELAAIRVRTRTGSFYGAVSAAAAHDAHAASFLELLGEFRRLSLTMPPEELIGELLRRTGFDVLCRGMKNGAHRLGNLVLLQEYAAESGAGAVPTLEGFLRGVERIRRRGKDLSPAAQGEGEDAVSIVTIHRSKGLEWPIVFVCGLDQEHGFFRSDLQKPTILHSEYGFACVRRDRATRRQFVSVPLAAVRAEEQRAQLSEELRVLYVAMTRARERLYLTGTLPDPEAALRDAAFAAGEGTSIDPAFVRGGKTFLQWLLPALSLHRDLRALASLPSREDGLRVRLPDPPRPVQAAETAAAAPTPDEAAAQALYARILRPYPHAAAAGLPSKLAVSALAHGEEGRFFTGVPAFVSGGRLTGAARGTAVHAFLQYCDYAAARRDPAAEAERLRAGGFLTAEQAEAVDLRQIRAFFESDLARRIFAADRVLREYRMLAPASASALTAQYVLPDGESTMLQGVADCILIEGDHAVLIDYKTDRVSHPEELIGRYRMQLLLYRDLLARALPVPVTECVLYSFSLGCAVPLEL